MKFLFWIPAAILIGTIVLILVKLLLAFAVMISVGAILFVVLWPSCFRW
jgi:hypothetical protein